MPLNRLPLEILSIIVASFRGNHKALKELSLVSRPFLNICRMFLFTKLRIDSLNPEFSKSCDFWFAFLRRNPSIHLRLEEIELGPPIFRVIHWPITGRYLEHWSRVTQRKRPSFHDPRLLFILDKATNVRKLTLRFEFQSWNNCSAIFRQTLERVLPRGQITSLNIEDAADFPLQLLANMKELKHLALAYNSRTSNSDSACAPADDGIRQRIGYLETLTLFESEDCVEPLVQVLEESRSSLRISKLLALSVNAGGMDGRIALKVIPPLAPNIQSLELRVGDRSDGYNRCNLGAFPLLRTLLINTPYDCQSSPIANIRRLLSHSGKLSEFEELKVTFRLDTLGETEGRFGISLLQLCADKNWILLGLKGQAKYPAFRKTSLVLRPKDVERLMSEHPGGKTYSSPLKSLHVPDGASIEIMDDHFEQYTGEEDFCY